MRYVRAYDRQAESSPGVLQSNPAHPSYVHANQVRQSTGTSAS